MRTKGDWKEYQETSAELLEEYQQQNPTNDDFFPMGKSFAEKFKDLLPFGSKNNDETLDQLISGELKFAKISEDFDEWSIYFLAHKVRNVCVHWFLILIFR